MTAIQTHKTNRILKALSLGRKDSGHPKEGWRNHLSWIVYEQTIKAKLTVHY
jgi:hypothetical protein